MINQTAYIDELLGKFGMGDSRPVTVGTPIVSLLSNADRGNGLSKENHAQYRVIIRSLLYLSCWPRPDISFAVSEVSISADPGDTLYTPSMKAAKRVLRYLKDTRDLGLRFTRPKRDKPNQVWGYVDSDRAGCPDSRRSRQPDMSY